MTRIASDCLGESVGLEIGRIIGAQQDGLAIAHSALDGQRGDRMTNASEGRGVIGRGPGPSRSPVMDWAKLLIVGAASNPGRMHRHVVRIEGNQVGAISSN